MYLSNYLSIYIYLSAYLKTKLFCETSSMFELDNIKNAAILRDFLNFWTWRRQKRSNSVRPPQVFKLTTSKTKQFCETSFKNGKLSAELTAFDGLVPMRFAIFPVDVSKLLRLPLKKGCQVIRRAAPVTQNHLSKPEDLMLQNAIFLRKSLSRICLLHTAPATRNASFQTVFKCPTPAIVFRLPSFFACHRFWKCYKTFTLCWLFIRCTIPCACHAKRHLNSQKCSVPFIFCTFDLDMCFAPQQRALFRHVDFQKWSDTAVLCTFWLVNVLRATTACTFHLSSHHMAPHLPL